VGADHQRLRGVGQASGLSFRTVEHYSDVLHRVLLGYCTRNKIEPQALTKRDLERQSAELFAAGRSRQSVKTYMSAINRFLTRLRVLAPGEGGAWLERVLARADEALANEPAAERRSQAERIVMSARALATTLRRGESLLLDVARPCKEFNRSA